MTSLADVVRSLGHEVVERDPAYNEIGTVFIPRYLKGIQADAEAVPRPHRLQRRTRGFATLGRLLPQAALDRALRDEARQAARINEIFDDVDVVLTPTTARPPVAAAEWEGLERDAHPARDVARLSVHRNVERHRPARARHPRRLHRAGPAAGRPADRPPGGRGHAALAGRAGGGGAAVGGPPPRVA